MQVLRKAFNQQLDECVSEFVNSVDVDKELIVVDILGSIAHATMLGEVGLLTSAQANNIVQGLQTILSDARSGKFVLNPAHEDVHMNVEKQLEKLIGEDALRLHTSRSRNDQVALDIRLYVLEQMAATKLLLTKLQLTLLERAEKNMDVVMPGYTHLQRAQPVLFSHAMHAYVQMLARDAQRFDDARQRCAVSPLGAGAQAGTSLPIAPDKSAAHLGLSEVFANSIDAVSDRDFVAEFLFTSALTAVHLSQLSETLIIWASREFGFVTFSDAVTTASSLMPQKKNPDPIEIVRGKTGTMIGELVNVLTTLKGMPLGYNRDLQETKGPAVHVAKELKAALSVMCVAVEHMTVNGDTARSAASDPDMMTTDLVEYLVRSGVPFRQAHEQVSHLVAFARQSKTSLADFKLADLCKFAPAFKEDVFKLFDPLLSVSSKSSPGSTGTNLVKRAVEKAKADCLGEIPPED